MSEPVQVRNAADPEQVQKAARKEQRAVDVRHNLLAFQLATPQGREYVASLIAGFLEFEVGPSTLEVLAFESGRRAEAGKLIKELLDEHPKALALVLSEAIARHEREQAERLASQSKRAH